MHQKFPHFRQNNAADCGPTCLRIIAKFYNLDFTSEMLRQNCSISHEGVNLFAIKNTAEIIGFNAIGVKLTFQQLVERNVFPCILHWNQNHFVVCYNIKRDLFGQFKIQISDPASQCLSYNKEDFMHYWIGENLYEEACGIALLLEPKENYTQIVDKHNNKSHNLLSFFKYLTPYRLMIGQLFLAIIVGSIFQIAPPFLSQAMIDQGICSKNLSVVTMILLAQLFFFITTLSIDYIRSCILLHINSRIDISLVADFLIKLTAMPLYFFDFRITGDVL